MLIKLADFSDPQTLALLNIHLKDMDAASPIGTNYTLDLAELKNPKLDLWAAWDGASLAGFCALKKLTSERAEIKSMRTHPDHLRKGIAQKLLKYIINIANERGYERLSLETGTTVEYEPALALYKKHGFVNGDIFGDYRPSPYNQFLHLDL